MTEIWELEANEISDLFRKKKISSIEIVDSLEKRLNEINPKDLEEAELKGNDQNDS